MGEREQAQQLCRRQAIPYGEQLPHRQRAASQAKWQTGRANQTRGAKINRQENEARESNCGVQQP
jgi:hypothetical protein